jgi:hypothetical protein
LHLFTNESSAFYLTPYIVAKTPSLRAVESDQVLFPQVLQVGIVGGEAK